MATGSSDLQTFLTQLLDNVLSLVTGFMVDFVRQLFAAFLL